MRHLSILVIFFLLVCCLSGACQTINRPPTVTGELQTITLKWNNLLMYRDSLVYFRPVSENSFQVRRPNSAYWYTYVFNADSTNQHDSVYVEWESRMKGDKDTIRTPLAYTYAINEEGDTITLIEGGTFTRNDSTFQVRKDPFCSYCWQYKYSSETDWKELYCESVSTGRILIDDNAEKILGMTYDLNIGNWRDRLFFQTDTAAKKDLIIMQRGDSVDWQPVPVDSVFLNSEWIHGGDSLGIDSDSIFYEDSWLKNGDSLKIELPRTDSLFWYAGKWIGRKDTINISNRIDTIYSQVTRTDTVFSQIVRTDTIYSHTTISDTIYSQVLRTDTIVLNGAGLKDEKVLLIDPSSGYPLYTGYLSSLDFSIENIYGSRYFKVKEPSKWDIDAAGIHLKNSLSNYNSVGIGANSSWLYGLSVVHSIGESSVYSTGVKAQVDFDGRAFWGISSGGTAGYFEGLTGVWTNNEVIQDSFRVGSGSTITRTGTMAEMDFWSGTKAEYDAISHDQNTLYYISENFRILQIIFFLLIALGSKAQNWSAVKVGSTDIDSIMKGDVKIWGKPNSCITPDFPEVTIGTQTWMAVNLSYNDGGTGIYAPNNNPANVADYGYLYTIEAMNRIVNLFCPGWHVPSTAEFTDLANYLGGWNCGGKMKETGYVYWKTPNTGATNISGFSGRAAGIRGTSGTYNYFKEQSSMWTSTQYDASNTYFAYLVYTNVWLAMPYYRNTIACSVRLIKD